MLNDQICLCLFFLMLVKKNPKNSIIISWFQIWYYYIRFYCFFICRKKLNVPFVGQISRLKKGINCMYMYIFLHLMNNMRRYMYCLAIIVQDVTEWLTLCLHQQQSRISNLYADWSCFFSWFKCNLYGSIFVKLKGFFCDLSTCMVNTVTNCMSAVSHNIVSADSVSHYSVSADSVSIDSVHIIGCHLIVYQLTMCQIIVCQLTMCQLIVLADNVSNKSVSVDSVSHYSMSADSMLLIIYTDIMSQCINL